MPVPVSITYKNVTGRYVDAAGAAMTGTVTFTPLAPRIVDATDNTFVATAPVEATLDVNGTFTASLMVGNDSDVTPSGWSYEVRESLRGPTGSSVTRLPSVVYSVAITSAMTSPIALSGLAPTSPPVAGAVGWVRSVNGLSGEVVLTAGDLGLIDEARAAKLDQSWVHRGVNLAGAEFGTVGDAYNTSWRYPTAEDWNFTAARGWTWARMPIKWARVQPTLGAALDATQVTLLQETINHARAAGVRVIIDLHDYGRRNGFYLGAADGPTLAQFKDIWLRISALFGDDEIVVGYGLMNEPNSMPTVDSVTGRDRWMLWSQEVLMAIRATGDPTCIMVSGYTSGIINSWFNSSGGTPNPFITDPLNNFMYEGHQYWGGVGDYPNTYAAEQALIGGAGDPLHRSHLPALKNWTDWGRKHNVRLFAGEIGWPRVTGVTTEADSDLWNELGEQYLQMLDAEGVSSAIWAAGSKWSSGYNLKPYLNDGSGHMATLAENAATMEAHKSFRINPPDPDRGEITALESLQRYRAMNFDLEHLTDTTAAVNGQVYVSLARFYDAGRVDQITVFINTAAVTPTAGQNFVALYDAGTGAQVAVSADISSSLTSTGFVHLALSTYTDVYRRGRRVYAGFVFNCATPPVLGRCPMPSGALTFQLRRYAVVGTGATAMPATISPGSWVAPTNTATSAYFIAASGY